MSARALQDLELVTTALAGRASAYEELLRHHGTAVFHLVLKLAPQADDAEDVTMETFGKAFRHLGRYSSQFAFSTWLFRIATNNCIDFVRRKKLATLSLQAPAHRNEDGECTLELCDGELNPQDAFTRQQRCERVRAAVARLPVKYGDLVRLRYVRGAKLRGGGHGTAVAAGHGEGPPEPGGAGGGGGQ